MRRLGTCFLFLLLVGSLAARVMAQPQQWAIERLTTNDGLPENEFHGLTQDKQGFLWAATRQSGLVRYDGYRFINYTHDAEDSTSIAHDSLTTVYTDRAGMLWVGTFDGLDKLDRTTDTFVHFRHDPEDTTSLSGARVTEVLEDRHGQLWVGTNAGLNRMDRATGTFVHYRHHPDDPNSLAHDYVTALYEDRDGILWVGTRGGLHRLHAAPSNEAGPPGFIRYQHDPADPTTLGNDNVGVLYEDSRGNFWVGTSGTILHHMDRVGGRFTRFHEPGGFFGMITTIEEDAEGMLWITAGVAGARRFRFENEILTAEQDAGFLFLQGTHSMYTSRDGIRWFGTNAGLFRVDPTPQPITYQPIMAPTVQRPVILSLTKDREGLFWIGTEAGLAHYDPTSGASNWYRHDPENPSSLADDTVLGIFEDRTGDLWINTASTFHRLDHRTKEVTRVLEVFASFNGIEDEAGDIWTVGVGGAFKVDPSSGTYASYTHARNDATSIGSNWAQYLIKGRDGTPWIGLLNGVSRYNRESDTFTSFFPAADSMSTVTSPDVHAFIEDRYGRLWYGSPHGQPGLNRLDPSTARFEHIPSPASTVYSFLEDEEGNLWMASDAGLLMYDMAGETFISYAEHPVLHDWDVGGFSMGAYKDAAGTMFFGAVGGIYSFNPQQLRALTPSPPPQVALTELEVGLASIVPGADAPIQQPIWEAETVTLAHSENTFAITFAGLHFQNPASNRHQYLLEGYDANWREAGEDRRAEYVKVPPGRYVFRAKAANSDGVWSEDEAAIHVRILPPWWRTGWAYTFYGILLLMGIYAVDRYQRRRIVQKEREKAQARELEQARALEKAHTALQQSHQHLKTTQAQLVHQEKMASLGALTAGIAHEIKNPLNFINNFAEVNEELADELQEALTNGETVDDLLADLKQNAAVIAQHGKRADGIVKSMMAHAREGKGEREAVNLNGLIDEHVELAYHGKRAQVPDFNVEIVRAYDEAVGKVDVMQQDMGRVILNLVSNAFDAVMERAARENGPYAPTVTVSTRRISDQVEIRVEDNGPGMSDEVKAKVFEPFFTTKPTGSGTGLGLSLSYDIITQGHGGTLTVKNDDEKGAVFSITLPGPSA